MLSIELLYTMVEIGNDASTEALWHFDDTAPFEDSSGNGYTLTAIGNATRSATGAKFGGQNLYLDW